MFKRLKIVAESISSKVCEQLAHYVDIVAESVSSKVCDKLADSVLDIGLNSLVEFDSKLENLNTNLGILNSVASDIETQIKKEELSGKKKRKREVEEWLKRVQETKTDIRQLKNEIQEKQFVKRFTCLNRVEKLNARVEGLREQSQHFDGLLLDANCGIRGERLLTSKLSGETFERILETIWECFCRVGIIGIYGMAGVGKTTLAMHIHDLVLDRTDDRVYWVKVSQEFSIKKLQDDIAKAIGMGNLAHDNDEDKRAAELNRALTRRKSFVLILDNVCEDINLERLGYPLGVDGCRLIITTRFLRVCRRIGCQEKFEVKTLEEDEAWGLFKETFGQETTLSPQAEEIAKQMVKNHGGLPQGIIDLARDMRGVTAIGEWRNALAEVEERLAREGDDVEDDNSGTVCSS